MALWNAQTVSGRIPDEVRFKTGYVNPVPRPAHFTSAMLWGIAIANTKDPPYQRAQVEISETELSCRVDGAMRVLNHDQGSVRGALYLRIPWFAGNQSEPMPVERSTGDGTTILRVGQRPDRIWHFWAASPRATIPSGTLDGCAVKMRVRISQGALLQVGLDYWRDSTVPFGTGGNNHEAGASKWYVPSKDWQQAVFTDIAAGPGDSAQVR